MADNGENILVEFDYDNITLIDPNKAWHKKSIKESVIRDERNYRFPERRTSQHNYMDEWVNPKEVINKQREEIKKQEASDFLDVFDGPEKDIFGYIKMENLKPIQIGSGKTNRKSKQSKSSKNKTKKY